MSEKLSEQEIETILDQKQAELDAMTDICPKCGVKILFGYGLAGGGIGSYVYCSNEQCDFFEKTQDPELREPVVLREEDQIELFFEDRVDRAVQRVIDRHMAEWEIELRELVTFAHRSIGQLTRFDHIEKRVAREMKK